MSSFKDASLFHDRGPKAEVENGDVFSPRFDSDGLIPAIATDHETGEVLMVAYMNRTALAETIRLREAVYWSRSRQELWHKGATSGHTQLVKEVRVDCDQDAIWLRVEQQGGGACHTGHRSCFYRAVALGEDSGALHFTESAKAFDPESVYGTKE